MQPPLRYGFKQQKLGETKRRGEGVAELPIGWKETKQRERERERTEKLAFLFSFKREKRTTKRELRMRMNQKEREREREKSLPGFVFYLPESMGETTCVARIE